MAVTGDPESRHGIILAKNQPAKKYDIKTAETIWQAKRKCPELVCVPTHFDIYNEISKKINSIYLEYTDLVEPASIDESYLDVSSSIHIFGYTPVQLADTLRRRIREEIGITISVGVSFCKPIAKFGSDYKNPDATTLITPENLEEIYWPHDVSQMLMAGQKTVKKLNDIGIHTIGELACADKDRLNRLFGKAGTALYNCANGFDTEKVRSYYEPREAKSVGNSMTFKRDLKGEDEIKAGLALLSDLVAGRLRADNKKCTCIQVGIRDPEFRSVQRQKTLESPTNLQKEISEAAMRLLRGNWSMSQPVRLLAVTAGGLIDEKEDFQQINLFENSSGERERQNKIENTMDDIRKKFGASSIRFGYFNDEETGIKTD